MAGVHVEGDGVVVAAQVQVDVSEKGTTRGFFARTSVGEEARVNGAVRLVCAIDIVVDEPLGRVELGYSLEAALKVTR
jgi:dTDP-4-dehydrorhamnose 3,5-epimerase-like enzyme